MLKFSDWPTPENAGSPEYTLIYERIRLVRKAATDPYQADVATEKLLQSFLTHSALLLGRDDVRAAVARGRVAII